MLIDIKPSEDGIECTTWSNKACAAFMVMSDEVNPNDSKLSALICEIDSDVHKVVLYNHKSRGEFCINSKLISQGHATVLDSATCLFYKQNSRKPYPIKAPIQMNIRTVSIIYLGLIICIILYAFDILFYLRSQKWKNNLPMRILQYFLGRK